MSQNPVDLARAGYEAFAGGDPRAVLGLLHPDIEWIAYSGNDRLPGGGTFHGIQDVTTSVFGRMAHTWESFAFRPHAFVGAGEHVVVTGRMWGRTRGTGAEVDVPFAHVWTIADGKAQRVELFTDTLAVFEAISMTHVG